MNFNQRCFIILLMFSHGAHCYVCVYMRLFQMQIWKWFILSVTFVVTTSYCSALMLQQKVKQTKVPRLLVLINNHEDVCSILMGLWFALRIKLNTWPVRLIWLILLGTSKVTLRIAQKHKDFTGITLSSKHRSTPSPGAL